MARSPPAAAASRCAAPSIAKPSAASAASSASRSAEMPVGRVVGDAGAARQRAQRERLNSFFFKDFAGRPEQRGRQVAMVVAALAAR